MGIFFIVLVCLYGKCIPCAIDNVFFDVAAAGKKKDGPKEKSKEKSEKKSSKRDWERKKGTGLGAFMSTMRDEVNEDSDSDSDSESEEEEEEEEIEEVRLNLEILFMFINCKNVNRQ